MIKREFLVSDDTSVLATPGQVVSMYGKYTQDTRYGFAGIEAMGWITCPLFLVLAGLHTIPVAGIHGRLGRLVGTMPRSARMKRTVIEQFLLPTRMVIAMAKIFQVGYILVHVAEAQENFALLKTFRGQVRIENDIIPGFGQDVAMGVTRSLARYCDARYNPDTVHRAIEVGRFTSANEVVRLGTEELRGLVKEKTHAGVPLVRSDHQAIGEVRDDSFDPLEADAEVLRERGSVYAENLRITTVFENQQNSGSIVMPSAQFARAQALTVRKMRKLHHAGWIG